MLIKTIKLNEYTTEYKDIKAHIDEAASDLRIDEIELYIAGKVPDSLFKDIESECYQYDLAVSYYFPTEKELSNESE